MNRTPCNRWLDTFSDAELDNHSQESLANLAWDRGAAFSAERALLHLDLIDTTKVAVTGLSDEATAISSARIILDAFIRRVKR